MSFPKVFLIGTLFLFTVITGVSLLKKKKNDGEITLNPPAEVCMDESKEEVKSEQYLTPVQDEIADQEIDQVWRLFTTGRQKLPVVESIRYQPKVSWLKGRPAWVTDYASHYSTSRHFIARSLNGKVDYESQKVSHGDQFNVLKDEISFYLVVDLSRCKMWFYVIDEAAQERMLLKTYKVGLGRFDQSSYSGLLTPKGKFRLGDKVAIYKPGMTGYFQDEQIEMIRVFGTRWIPFIEEVSGGGDNPRGYGFHGAPWIYDLETAAYQEDGSTLGKYESDGCVRLAQEDIEELYAIVITKPTIVEIVTDFHDAEVPGQLVEK